MDIVEAARVLARSLATRSDSGQPADADDDSYAWLSQEIDLRRGEGGHHEPPAVDETTAVIAQLIARAFADQAFAEDLMRRGSLAAAATAAAPAPAGTQQSTVSHGGVALNAARDLNASGARIAGRDDNSGQVYHLAERATMIQHPVTTVTGKKAQVFYGTSVIKRKLFLPLGFMVRIGNKAGTLAAAHPAVAVATCTIVVVGGTAGAVVLNQGPAAAPSLAAAPVSFSGLWQGTVSDGGKSGYAADVAITGGPVKGTVGSVNLATLPCTSTLTLTEAHDQALTIEDDATSGSCAGGTLVLTPQGPDLRYTLAHADGTTATGVLTRVQSFAAQAPVVTPTAASTPLPAVTATSASASPTDCGVYGTTNNGTQSHLQVVGTSCATGTSVMTGMLAQFGGYGMDGVVSYQGWKCSSHTTGGPPTMIGNEVLLVDCVQNEAKIYWTDSGLT